MGVCVCVCYLLCVCCQRVEKIRYQTTRIIIKGKKGLVDSKGLNCCKLFVFVFIGTNNGTVIKQNFKSIPQWAKFWNPSIQVQVHVHNIRCGRNRAAPSLNSAINFHQISSPVYLVIPLLWFSVCVCVCVRGRVERQKAGCVFAEQPQIIL